MWSRAAPCIALAPAPSAQKSVSRCFSLVEYAHKTTTGLTPQSHWRVIAYGCCRQSRGTERYLLAGLCCHPPCYSRSLRCRDDRRRKGPAQLCWSPLESKPLATMSPRIVNGASACSLRYPARRQGWTAPMHLAVSQPKQSSESLNSRFPPSS